MTETGLSRRTLLASMPMVAGAGLAEMAASNAAASAAAPSISAAEAAERLTDPATRARVRTRVIGSVAEEISYKFFRLHLYAFLGDGNLIPLFTMNHLSAGKWRPAGNDLYHSTTWECGYYCRFDTDEPLERWENPVTGETLDVFQFLGGPFEVNIGADGVETRGADLRPQVLRMEAINNQLIVPTIASMALPQLVDGNRYPASWSGPTTFWESQATFSATVDDAFNEELNKAPAFCHFQNLASWHPWLRMGNRPGRTYGNARGAKIASLSEIPPRVLADLEKYTPEIFDLDSWTSPRLETQEYLATQTPVE